MRKRVIFLSVVALIGVFTLLALRAIMLTPTQQSLDALVTSALHDTLKGSVTLNATSSVTLFPRPELILSSPTIKAEDGTIISSNRIVLSFGLVAFFTGQYQVVAVTIDGGEIVIPERLNPRDLTQSENTVKAFVSYMDEMNSRPTTQTFETIRLTNIAVHFRGSQRVAVTTIQNATIQLNKDGAFQLDVKASFNDVLFNLNLSLSAEERDARRERMVGFEYRDDQIQLSGSGVAATQPDIQFIGQVKFQTENLSLVSERLINQKNRAFATSAKMRAESRLSFSSMTFSKMEWAIGNANLDGNMILDLSRENPHITGTFATNSINLTDFFDHVGLKRDQLGQWSNDKFPNALFPDLDLDLRISSDLVTIYDVGIKSMALSVLLKRSNLELSVASGDLFEGAISGKINVAPQNGSGRQSVKATIDISDIDIERTLLKLIDTNRVSGIASSQILVQSQGQSSAELVGNLSGTIDIDASRVSFVGVNLLNFLHRVEQRPLGAGIALKSGTTEFDIVHSSLVLANGIGTLKSTNLTRLPDLQIKMNGQIDLGGQALAITGHALAASSTDANQSINLPFVLRGPFNNPAFLPDFINVSKQAGPVAAE